MNPDAVAAWFASTDVRTSVVMGASAGYQVEDGLGDRGSGQLPVWLRVGPVAGRPVDCHPVKVSPPGWMSADRDRDMDCAAISRAEAVEFRRGLMT